MATQYTYARQSTAEDGNIIVITVTNGSGAAWGSYFLAAYYTYYDSTASTTSSYLTEQTGATLGASSTVNITLPIGTAAFTSALASNLLVGVSFPANTSAIT